MILEHCSRASSSEICERELPVTPNRSFDTDTQQHCAARRVGERTPCGATPLRAGQLQR